MMNVFNIKRNLSLGLISACALSISACSTTSNVKVASGAPITYKVDQNSIRMASLTKPNLPPVSTVPQSRPVYTIPSPYTPQGQPAPRAQAEVPLSHGVAFDPASVDRDLYAHQRVGKRYSIMGKSYKPKHQPDYDKVGEASWYGDKFHGKPTATGEIYNKNDMTAAHKTLPLNSMLHVTNLDNGKSIMVRLNDRGPFIGERIIDLSEAAANALGTAEMGVGRVRVRYVGPADPMAPQRLVEAPRPRSVPQSAPPTAVPAPRPVPQAQTQPSPLMPHEYKPLRRQKPPAEQAYAPAPMPEPTPREYAPYDATPQPAVPQAAQPLPQKPTAEDDDEVITLTIKGPIHMAKSTHKQKAEWIPAVNYRRIHK